MGKDNQQEGNAQAELIWLKARDISFLWLRATLKLPQPKWKIVAGIATVFLGLLVNHHTKYSLPPELASTPKVIQTDTFMTTTAVPSYSYNESTTVSGTVVIPTPHRDNFMFADVSSAVASAPIANSTTSGIVVIPNSSRNIFPFIGS